MCRLQGHTDVVLALERLWGSDGLASGSADTSIRVWNTDACRCDRTLAGHTHAVTSLRRLPGTGHRLASGSFQQVKVWNVQNGECVRTLDASLMNVHTDTVRWLEVLTNAANQLASVSHKEVAVWDLEKPDGKGYLQSYRPKGGASIMSARRLVLNISSEGEDNNNKHQLLFGLENDRVIGWRYVKGKNGNRLPPTIDFDHESVVKSGGGGGGICSLDQIANTNMFASGSEEGVVRVWHVTGGDAVVKTTRVLRGHRRPVWSLCFASQELLVSSGDDYEIRLWNVKSGECLTTVRGLRRPYPIVLL